MHFTRPAPTALGPATPNGVLRMDTFAFGGEA